MMLMLMMISLVGRGAHTGAGRHFNDDGEGLDDGEAERGDNNHHAPEDPVGGLYGHRGPRDGHGYEEL